MKKTIRLTESDLIRVIKKIVKENNNERFIAKKVESKVETPQIERTVDNILSNLSNSEINDLKNLLLDLGIDENSSAMEIHNKIENEGLSHSNSEEMTEEDEMDDKKNLKTKVSKTLHSIGAGNIAAWGGVPAAIVIGSATGMPLGFAISWGVTGLLMGLAKALNKEN